MRQIEKILRVCLFVTVFTTAVSGIVAAPFPQQTEDETDEETDRYYKSVRPVAFLSDGIKRYYIVDTLRTDDIIFVRSKSPAFPPGEIDRKDFKYYVEHFYAITDTASIGRMDFKNILDNPNVYILGCDFIQAIYNCIPINEREEITLTHRKNFPGDIPVIESDFPYSENLVRTYFYYLPTKYLVVLAEGEFDVTCYYSPPTNNPYAYYKVLVPYWDDPELNNEEDSGLIPFNP